MSKHPVDYALHYGGGCRDCADEDGTCPTTGIPCDPDVTRAVAKHCLEAWVYGIKHGFMENPFAQFDFDARIRSAIEVKALDWVEVGEGSRCITICGRYAIHPSSGPYGHPTMTLTGMPGDLFGKFDSVEAAKAAAQSDFDARIRSAIERKAEPACVACEDRPSAENNPCAVCGASTPPAEPDIEHAAKNIFEAMRLAAKEAGFDAPTWVERGNSNMQEEARRAAFRILSASPSPVGESRDALIERLTKALEPFETARHEVSYMRADDVPLSKTIAGEILTCGQFREVCAAYRDVLAAKEQQP